MGMMQFETVHAAFRATAERHGGNDFVCVLPETAEIYGIPAGAISYRDALARIDRLTELYRAAGYGHGHRAGLLLENRPDFLLHWLALNALGVSIVPISVELRVADLAYLVGHSEMDFVLTLPKKAKELADAAREAGRDLAILVHGETSAIPPARSAPPRTGAPGQASECALLYTSGTTGRPKGCVLSNTYFLYGGEWYTTAGGHIALRPGTERVITPLPLNHMNALAVSTMAMIANGGCIIQLDRFHPKSWWNSVRESRATFLHYLGVMPAMLMSAPADPSDRAHSVRFALGAAVDKKQHAPFEERFGFPLLEAWAMTETGSAGTVIANEEPRKVGTATFGKPVPELEVRVVDDAGQIVPHGTPGELLVRRAGPDPRYAFFSGYLKDEQATEEAWQGGFFHTGDLVIQDADGFLYFQDRKKNVIRRSGENISAVEVETVIRRHPAVKDVACAATPDPIRQDEVLACVILREDAPADRRALAESIVALCLEQLAYYKAPGYVAFVDALPLTPTQKVQRAQLKALAANLPADPACFDLRHLKKRRD